MARAPHFLLRLVKGAPAGLCLRNQRTGQVLATTLLPALDSATRKTGLLKHTSLADGEAMVIAPSNAVHTWFMKFDLDLIFVGRDGRVVKTRGGVKPWRMSGALRAFAVIEMRAGTLAERDTKPGDVLEVVPAWT
ncbi:MAG TPA: DUF192 domain-containing protein [Vicinamibacterales bacterium]|nr:DUF192 domain-containing protein [Vicinamibacterales bacterium]